MDNSYKSLFAAMQQENKKLENALPEEIYRGYEQYLAEINSIVEGILLKAGYNKKVKYSVYEDCCKVTIAGLMSNSESDYAIINIFINLYAETSFNGNTDLAIDATVRLIYSKFYNT